MIALALAPRLQKMRAVRYRTRVAMPPCLPLPMLSSQMSLAAKRTGWNAFLWGTCIDAPIDLAIGGRTPSSIPPSQRRAGPIRSGRPCHSSARSTCCGGHCVWKDGDRKVRVKPLAGGARALVLFDRGAAHDDPRHLEQLSFPSISARECVTSGRTRICRAGPVRSSDGRTSRGREVPDRPLTAVNRSGELLLQHRTARIPIAPRQPCQTARRHDPLRPMELRSVIPAGPPASRSNPKITAT